LFFVLCSLFFVLCSLFFVVVLRGEFVCLFVLRCLFVCCFFVVEEGQRGLFSFFVLCWFIVLCWL